MAEHKEFPVDASGVSTPAEAVVAPRSPRGAAALRPEHLYKAIGLAFLFALFYRFFGPISQTLLLLYAAAVFAVLLNAIVRRLPLQRKWVTAGIGILIVGSIVAILWLGVPALIGQIRDIAGRAPEFTEQLEGMEDWIQENTGLNVQLVGPEAEEWLRDAFAGAAGSGSVISTATGLLQFVFVPLLILFGGLFAVANPNERLLSPVLRAVPRDMRLAFRRMFELLGVRLIGWIEGTLIGMVAVGVLSFALFYLIGVPNAFLLGVVSGLTEFIPLLGPWIGGAIATAVAFLDDPQKGVWTALAALAIQQFENNVIIPWAMSRAADVHPLVTLFALVLFGSLFGFLGILLSIPLVMLFWTMIEVLWVERTLDSDEDSIAPIVKE